MLILLIILLLVLGAGGGYYGHSRWVTVVGRAWELAPSCSFYSWSTCLGLSTNRILKRVTAMSFGIYIIGFLILIGG